jgi:hypothetical protein
MNNTSPEKIIEEIKKQGIESRPRWQFLLKRWTLWSMAILSIIVGSIAVAVIIFTFIDYDTSVRTYLQKSAVENILLSIPYFWLVTLVILVGITKYAVRHTKFGYRYATTRIVMTVLVGSMLLGIGLNFLDVGESVQNFLVDTFPAYDSLVYTSKDAWSQPDKGLLGGTVIMIVNSDEFTIMDFHKKTWQIDTSELQGKSDIDIKQGIIVKIIGTKKDNSTFQAGQIFLWSN